MAANFNFEVDYPGLIYKDAKGRTVKMYSDNNLDGYLTGYSTGIKRGIVEKIAPAYTEKQYAAKSLVSNFGILYYNPNAISTAESWNKNHWTQTTIADYLNIIMNV